MDPSQSIAPRQSSWRDRNRVDRVAAAPPSGRRVTRPRQTTRITLAPTGTSGGDGLPTTLAIDNDELLFNMVGGALNVENFQHT
jgi:hypothetical protein